MSEIKHIHNKLSKSLFLIWGFIIMFL